MPDWQLAHAPPAVKLDQAWGRLGGVGGQPYTEHEALEVEGGEEAEPLDADAGRSSATSAAQQLAELRQEVAGLRALIASRLGERV